MKPIVCLGEALVDILPLDRRQRLQEATVLRRVAGGATANVTVGLARLGLNAAFLGKVGADPFGYFLRDTLSRAGVDVSHLGFSPTANTGLSFAWVEDAATGEAHYLFFRQPTADRTLEMADIDRAWLEQACLLQYGSLLLSTESGAAAVWAAIETVRAVGLPCIYDLNLRLPAWPNPDAARAGMLAPLEVSDVVKLNRHELKFLTGETDLIRGADRLWRSNNRLLVVTLDRDGCYYRTDKGSGQLPGHAVQVVDTVAAGDAFMAALLSQLLNGTAGEWDNFDWDDLGAVGRACRYANAAGALTVTRAGAIPALPSQRQLARFLKSAQ